MKIAIILVHYHTPELLQKAVEAIKSDLTLSGLNGEIIVIDNGSRPEDKKLLNSLNVKLIDPGENLGYARGVNLGVTNTDADIFIFMNPDVQVLPKCLGFLVSILESGAAAAGPRFYLDNEKQIIHPPLMNLTIKNELLWRTSAFGENWAKWVRAMWRKEARVYWQTDVAMESYLLTGALIAIRRDAWEEIGPFDEIYQLYFEEVDWLKRLEKSRLKSYYVPDACAVHIDNQSVAKEPKAKKWFEESAQIFRKRHYGTLFNSFLNRIVPFLRRFTPAVNTQQEPNSLSHTDLPVIEMASLNIPDNTPIWIEISENDLGIPAAAMPVRNPDLKVWRFPKDLWDALEPKTYHFRLVDNAGNEIYHFTYAHYQAI